MDYEKAYTNAVARAKQAIKDCGHNEGRKRMIEDIFPELADPDRIRQEILEYISKATGCEKWIAWLEKQGKETIPLANGIVIPLEEIIHNVWELGNLWKELTNGVCTTEHGRQLDYIVKHWKEGEHYIKSLEKQGDKCLVNFNEAEQPRRAVDSLRSTPTKAWRFLRRPLYGL